MPNHRALPTPNPTSRSPKRLGQWLKRWRQLDWRERGLVVEALVLLALARATVLFIPFKHVAPRLGTLQHETPTDTPTDPSIPMQQVYARLVTDAIRLVSRHTPWNSNCFAQALAGHVMLRRRRAASTLYLGVVKAGEGLAAHAWLRSGELIVTGGPGQERYAVVARYGWQPRKLATKRGI